MARRRPDDDDDDDERGRRCHICKRRAPGSVYDYWGMVCISESRVGNRYSGSFKNPRKVSLFVCDDCAVRYTRQANLGFAIACVAIFVALVVGCVVLATGFELPKQGWYGLLGATAFAGLLAGLGVLSMLRPLSVSLSGDAALYAIKSRTEAGLRLKGYGNRVFTLEEYRGMFKEEPPGAGYTEGETAEDILGAAGELDDDDDRPRRRKRSARASAAIDVKTCPHCRRAVAGYVQACPYCKEVIG